MSTLDEHGVGIVHHFVGGLYCKETHIPHGVWLRQHSHKFDHLSILLSGTVQVHVDGKIERYTGPALLTIPAGKEHSVVAVSDAVWACLHATDETDPDHVDKALTA